MSLVKIKNPYLLKIGDLITSDIILLRHIRTVFNELNCNACEKHDYKFVESVRYNKTLVDTEIMNNGEKDMIRAKGLSKVNIKHILVSPMKRTLVTCQEAIKIIENSELITEPPKIEIYPYLFEKIEDSCDLIRPISENMDYFKEFNFRNETFKVNWSNFDSLIENINYFQLPFCRNTTINGKLVSFENSHYYDFLTKATETHKIDYNDVQNYLIEEMKKLGIIHEHIEDYKSTFERIKKVNNRVKEILSTLDKSKNEKLLIIGHSVFFKAWYTDFVIEKTFDLVIENERNILQNCEIMGVNLSEQENEKEIS